MKTLSNLKLVGVDTNILIYYFEDNPQFGEVAKEFFDDLKNSRLRAITSIMAVVETLSKKGLPTDIAKDLEADLFEIPYLSILEVNRKIGSQAARIRREYQFGLPDSIQLATALETKANAFITNDDRLKKFKELKVILLVEL